MARDLEIEVAGLGGEACGFEIPLPPFLSVPHSGGKAFAGQGARQCAGITRTPRGRDRLVRNLGVTARVHERDLIAEPCEQLGSECVGKLGSPRERLLEQVHHQRVGAGSGPPQTAQDDRGVRDQRGVVDAPPDFGNLHERLTRPVRFARVVMRVGKREQQLGAPVLVGGVVELERLQREVVGARGFLVRGRRRGPATRARRVVDGLVDVAARSGLERVSTRAR